MTDNPSKSRMFRSLRFRMTVLNASTTVLLILVLRILTASWLTDKFTQAADTSLYERLSTELVQRSLPLPSRLTSYEQYIDATNTAYMSKLEAIRQFLPVDTPMFMAAMLANPNTVCTYTIVANSDGVPIRDSGTIPPLPLAYESLLAAVDAPDHFDARTIQDDAGNDIRIVSLHLPTQAIRYIQVGRPMADYVALEAQLRFILLFVGFLGIIVVVIASWFLSGYFVAPTARAYELQKRFITNASHELRTPLSIVRASAQIALLDAPAGHPSTELLHSIVAENKHMTNMIENLLTIARTEERLPSVARFDIIPILDETCRTVKRIAPERTIRLEYDPGSVFVDSNPHYIAHIIRILLDNAIAHTPLDAVISIHCSAGPHHTEIHVRDTGNGVSAVHVSSIFEPFVTYSRGTGHRGSGIGLNIALTFARAMNAQLRYEANQPHGACFVLVLPN